MWGNHLLLPLCKYLGLSQSVIAECKKPEVRHGILCDGPSYELQNPASAARQGDLERPHMASIQQGSHQKPRRVPNYNALRPLANSAEALENMAPTCVLAA